MVIVVIVGVVVVVVGLVLYRLFSNNTPSILLGFCLIGLHFRIQGKSSVIAAAGHSSPIPLSLPNQRPKNTKRNKQEKCSSSSSSSMQSS